MGWQVTSQAVPLFVAAALAGAAAVVAVRQREQHGSRLFVGFVLAAAWWSLGAGLELLRTDMPSSTLLTKATYLGIIVVPIAWVLFILEYTGRRQWFDRRRLGLLVVVPVISTVAVATNEPFGVHTLFWIEPELAIEGSVRSFDGTYGPLFWVHALYSYALLTLGSYWLLELAIFSEHRYRSQAIGLLGAVAAPVGVNALYIFDVIQTPYDPTVLGIVLSSVLILGSFRRHNLLDVVPAARELARSELLENLDDPIIVHNDDERVVDVNPAATHVFGIDRRDAIGEDIETVSQELHRFLDSDKSTDTLTRDVDDVTRYYDVNVTSLSTGTDAEVGQLLALRDVTAREHNRQQINVLNRLLRHNFSNAITVILGNAEHARDAVTDETIEQRLATVVEHAETVMGKRERLTRVLQSLEGEQYERGEVGDVIETVTAAIRENNPDADLRVEGPNAPLEIDGRDRLYIAIEELLVNAIEHNDGSMSKVGCETSVVDGVAKITVTDNGPGIPQHELNPITNGGETQLAHGDGVGLWLVSWIVHSLAGTIDVQTNDSGTTVTITVPGCE
ncbi:sensor histidine kinase [Halorhabdus salina]|uniref:sensor histidine kinase n=1 Tax=Halorhabdus salina TaxID=2750670 RepID=UPI0015EF9708|nr:histidine kinase N-terminal 7TM domain-containing protein [Halorhabdus salina]